MKFFCLLCKATFKNDEDVDKHLCHPLFKMTAPIEVVGLKCTRLGRFMYKIFSMDIGWGLAVMGLVIINVIVLEHLGLKPPESIIEILAFGFAIPRLLK